MGKKKKQHSNSMAGLVEGHLPSPLKGDHLDLTADAPKKKKSAAAKLTTQSAAAKLLKKTKGDAGARGGRGRHCKHKEKEKEEVKCREVSDTHPCVAAHGANHVIL